MHLTTDIHVQIKKRIQCPSCKETFDEPKDRDRIFCCPHCGTQLNIDREAIDNLIEKIEEQTVEALGQIGIQSPTQSMPIAKRLTRALNFAGGIAGVWIFLFPFPYLWAIMTGALIPVIAILTMMKFKGRINFETQKRRSRHPSLTFALAIPAVTLAWRALNDFHLFSFDHVWWPMAAISILYTVLLSMYSADIKIKPFYFLVALIFGCMYGYSLIIEINCLTDHSMPETFHAKVLAKRISSSVKSDAYYIKVAPWGPRTTKDEISIRKRGYEQIQVNEEIVIQLKKGSIDIPWFIIQFTPLKG